MTKESSKTTIFRLLMVAAVTTGLSACGGSSSDDAADGGDGSGTGSSSQNWSTPMMATIDASDGNTIGIFDLSSGTATTVSSMDEYTANWHFSYKKFRFFQTNSGSSGAGNNGADVESCRAYEYAGLYDENGDPVQSAFEALNATNTLANFESLGTDACATFTTDSEVTSEHIGDEWYVMEGHSLTIPQGTTGWIIKSADDTYARITPKEYNSALIFTMEKWNSDTTTWEAALDTPAIDYYMQSNAYYDFDTNTAGTSDTQGWDIHIKNTNHYPEIILGEGVTVGMYIDSSTTDDFTYESVAQLDSPVSPTVGATLYRWFGNNTSGSMSEPGDLGGIEMIGYSYFPTYTVYLFKEGNTYYKVQVLGYKGVDGEQSSGNIVVRYSSTTVTD